ncbi:IS66 family insertion sequence element accessory protein TnpB [Sinorhizobium medicae]|uniref:IS66 family insertion sequence element accessory protein TnpB n=2 Tax=Sinorhizobium medicae TaxID=110321 RepID=UPI001CF025FB
MWIASGHCDMRKGMQGLALLVQEGLGRDPFYASSEIMWRSPSRRQPRPAKSRILRHIIFRCCSAVAERRHLVGNARRDRRRLQPSRVLCASFRHPRRL